MKNETLLKDTGKIATANEEQLKNLLSKYIYLDQEQDKSIKNLEIALEMAKNKKIAIKDMKFKLNVALTPFQTSTVYSLEGKMMKVDKENLQQFLNEGYVEGEVLIYKKSKLSSTLQSKMSIEDYQKKYGTELHPMYTAKPLTKTLYAVIGTEEEVNRIAAEEVAQEA